MLKELSTQTKEKVRKIINSTNGRFFLVVFTKRTTGEERVMQCRTGVSKFIKKDKDGNGKGLAFKPKDHDLVPVWDLKAWDPENGDTGYRFINLRTVKEVRFAGEVHSFE